MRRAIVVAVVLGLAVAAVPLHATAGDTHAVRNRWAGVAIGASAAVVAGMLLSTLGTPVYAAPPPAVVVTPPPPVVYAPPVPVVYAYAPAPVVYAPSPVVVVAARGHGHRKVHHHRHHG